MTDINCYIIGLKSSWIKRIIQSTDTKWKILLNKITPLKRLLQTGSDHINAIKKDLVYPFWKDTFKGFQKVQDKLKLESWNDFMSHPLWNIPRIKIENKTISYKIWYDKNIIYISYLFDESGMFYSLYDLQKHYKIKTNFLRYASLQNSIKANISTITIQKENNNPKPIVS